MTPSRRTRRGAFTLPELLVAVTLFAIVGSACLKALSASGRWYERTTLVAEQQGQVDAAHRALAILPMAASPLDGDFTVMGDSSLTWNATIGSAVVCHIVAGAAIVPRAPLTTGVALAAFASTPQAGDDLLVFDDGPTPSLSDDRWTRHAIAAVNGTTGGCVGGPLADSVTDASTPAWRLTVAPPLGTLAGAPARVLRPQRLALYQSAGEWMLGFADVNGITGWTTIQPVAGPLASATPPGAGLELHWLDSLFVPTTTSVAAIRVSLRAPTRRAVRRAAGAPAPILDSLGFVVALRNRS